MAKFPPAEEIIEEAIKKDPSAEMNNLHTITYNLMLKHKENYYRLRVTEFLEQPSIKNLPDKVKELIGKELLKPIPVKDKIYNNFMEEVSRRISQAIQPISGNLAELCVEKAINKLGLRIDINYKKKIDHTDLIIYYPTVSNPSKRHRAEVKNVSLRERATRGLAFDGDSLVGFFNDPSEFTKENISIIDKHCKGSRGYCYLPPETLGAIEHRIKTERFKSNEEFAKDMKKFVEAGSI